MISSSPFGTTCDGRKVTCFHLANGPTRMAVLDYGGIVQKLCVPDLRGVYEDVTTGFDELAGYEQSQPYFGALIGRYANRIADGRFSLDGREYQLPRNNRPGGIPCALHGGLRGFHNSIWEVETFQADGNIRLVFHLESPDGDQGFPGKLQAKVTYTLAETGAWTVAYEAVCDRPTPVNFTQHIFFNLKGPGSGDILGHRLKLNARAFTPVTKGLIPTGEIRLVAGTPFDFQELHDIGQFIEQDDEQLRNCGGYDNNFVIDRGDALPEQAIPVALLCEPASGRGIRISTTEPGIQLYTGNFLTDKDLCKNGKPLGRRGALSLETQHFPDSPNHPNFPSTILRPGQIHRSQTTWEFLTTGEQR